MREMTNRELKKIISQHQRQGAKQQRETRRQQDKPVELQKAWNRTVTGLLRPLLDAFKKELSAAGHGVTIDIDFEAGTGRLRQYRDVTFSLVPAKYRDMELTARTTPSLAFELDTQGEQITLFYRSVLGSLGGNEGPNGEFKVGEITEALVEAKMLAFVGDILGR